MCHLLFSGYWLHEGLHYIKNGSFPDREPFSKVLFFLLATLKWSALTYTLMNTPNLMTPRWSFSSCCFLLYSRIGPYTKKPEKAIICFRMVERAITVVFSCTFSIVTCIAVLGKQWTADLLLPCHLQKHLFYLPSPISSEPLLEKKTTFQWPRCNATYWHRTSIWHATVSPCVSPGSKHNCSP